MNAKFPPTLSAQRAQTASSIVAPSKPYSELLTSLESALRQIDEKTKIFQVEIINEPGKTPPIQTSEFETELRKIVAYAEYINQKLSFEI